MRYLFVFTALLMLSGCSGTRDTLGLTKQAPDEFAVVKRAPLALPPDYALRPPQPGAPRPQEQATAEQAAVAVLEQTGRKTVEDTDFGQSDGENSLLQSAGASNIDPTIRQKVDSETANRVDTNKPVVDKILDLASDDDDVAASVVDPVKEAARIKDNQAEGKPITEGETPSIED